MTHVPLGYIMRYNTFFSALIGNHVKLRDSDMVFLKSDFVLCGCILPPPALVKHTLPDFEMSYRILVLSLSCSAISKSLWVAYFSYSHPLFMISHPLFMISRQSHISLVFSMSDLLSTCLHVAAIKVVYLLCPMEVVVDVPLLGFLDIEWLIIVIVNIHAQ